MNSKSAKFILEEIRREDNSLPSRVDMYEIINLVNKLSDEIKYYINKHNRYIYKLGINSNGEEEGISDSDYNIIIRVLDIICKTNNYTMTFLNNKIIDKSLNLSVYEMIIMK